MTIVVLAEKPSVARDIAAVVGASKRCKGYLEGGGYRVTWAIGHLVGLAEPRAMDASWARWSYHSLPMLPDHWPLVAREGVKEQLAVVRKLLTARATKEVVCATDAGREGELIFRYLYEHVGCKRPVRRLWISSLTAAAIRRGFANLEPAANYDGLAAAARARSRADWLVGMNLSRAYSLRFDDNLAVGRVQTPTLALIVAREHAIQDFVPVPYREVKATFRAPAGEYQGVYQCPAGQEHSFRTGQKETHGKTNSRRSWLPAEGDLAELIARRAKEGQAHVIEAYRKKRKQQPPLLFDLTDLQRVANRLYGLSAKRTLEVAQALYEKHKLISYPRTDSRHLSSDIAATLASVVAAVVGGYGDDAPAAAIAGKPLSRRFVDDGKVSDHHAIIPTATPSRLKKGSDTFKVYDLVCRRFLQAWCDDYVEAVTRAVTAIVGQDDNNAFEDHYRSRGTSVEQLGWKALEASSARAPRKKPDLPAGLTKSLPVEVLASKILNRTTKPPLPFSDATLLTAMETAGRTLDEKELSDAMRHCGLGTPATRAATIESLLSRQYLLREGKALHATPKGMDLIGRVHEHVKSPAMTGSWEARLQAVQRGEASFDNFMSDIEAFVSEVVSSVKNNGPEGSGAFALSSNSAATQQQTTSQQSPSGHDPYANAASLTTHKHVQNKHAQRGYTDHHDPYANKLTPAAPPRQVVGRDGLGALLAAKFGFDDFRPHQFDICAAITEGQDALVVMPTGAGKSLCYQLPGLARAGCTLVISPLVALIEDQVQKLQAMGHRADCIHAGRGRALSRQVCRAYLDGQLDYFFIAPERLGVRGFPQMLAKRPPALIAIDEAHCISDWGHDFRPDYRMLRQRLEALRAPPTRAPIVALTATATPQVQRDICDQLNLDNSSDFIFGFRRDNIGVEVVEVPPAGRPALALKLLSGDGRLPAIVYAPTRKKAEAQARTLGKTLRAGAYHAGLAPEKRDQVQRAFISGKLDVVVATVAFGMGIDKANVRTIIHTALPNTIEAYYQEIGRAGRDGAPSRAVLMHSFADVRILEFFLDRDYPPATNLRRVYKALSAQPISREVLSYEVKGKPEDVVRWIDKLWISGGADIDDQGEVTRGAARWKRQYEKQRQHKQAQVDAVRAFVKSSQCRMLALIAHFGDKDDSGKPCGLCDVCAPKQSLALSSHPPTPEEVALMANLIAALRQYNGQASGRLFREFAEDSCDRDAFERLVNGLQRADIVNVWEDSFEKDKKTIVFHRIDLIDTAITVEGLRNRVVLMSPPVSSSRGSSGASAGGRSYRKRGGAKGDYARRRSMNNTRNFAGRRSRAGKAKKVRRQP